MSSEQTSEGKSEERSSGEESSAAGGRASFSRISFIGPGKVGIALACLCRRAGYTIGEVVGRRLDSARSAVDTIGAGTASQRLTAAADLLFITTQDDAIESVVADLAERASEGDRGLLRGAAVLHVSGSRSSELLVPLRAHGARIATLHPLQSFADPMRTVETFGGTCCFHEGDDELRDDIVALIESIGGRPVALATSGKVLYHAAASLASNALVALLDVCAGWMHEAGVDRRTAIEALTPLVAGTLRNIDHVGIPQALTGPIERGDSSVVRGHLEALTPIPGALDAYLPLARVAVEIALAKGSIDPAVAVDLRLLLDQHTAGGTAS